MLAVLAGAGALIEKAVGHFAGSHIAGAVFHGIPIPAARAIADGLGLRGAAGLVAGLYVGNSGFRAGVDQAIRALVP